jgi:hypothetical protein
MLFLSFGEKMTLRNHSPMLVQHLEMTGMPLFHLDLALLMFRVRSPVLLILWRIISPFCLRNLFPSMALVKLTCSDLRDTVAAQSFFFVFFFFFVRECFAFV